MSKRKPLGRRGAALIEFALVALVTYMLIASILTFGSILWIGNTLQQAVDVGAHEVARVPFPADGVFDLGRVDSPPSDSSLSQDEVFKQQIYDEERLVIDPADLGGQSLADFANSSLPLVNRLLIPTYIFDRNSGPNGVYRYPGALVTNEDGAVTVLIPIVNDGTVTWVAPVEEIRLPDLSTGETFGQYSLVPPESEIQNFEPGIVALRINYPYQSASMSGFGESMGTEPHRGNIRDPLVADDNQLVDSGSGRYSLIVPINDHIPNEPNIYSGRFGLGRQIALPYADVREYGVRPYRRVISVQAVYRREVFDAPL